MIVFERALEYQTRDYSVVVSRRDQRQRRWKGEMRVEYPLIARRGLWKARYWPGANQRVSFVTLFSIVSELRVKKVAVNTGSKIIPNID